MKHLKTYLVEKEWDSNVIASDPTLGYERIKKIVVGYNTIERANEFCEIMNRECGNCPRRAALHTTYKVLDNPIHVRMYTAEEKMQGK